MFLQDDGVVSFQNEKYDIYFRGRTADKSWFIPQHICILVLKPFVAPSKPTHFPCMVPKTMFQRKHHHISAGSIGGMCQNHYNGKR